jgi:uncharacterized damage-inducible protein DinB
VWRRDRVEEDIQLWNQYQSLREEIRGADSLNYQIMAIVAGAVAALLTTGVKEADSLTRVCIFLCVYVVTIPGYRLLQGNRLRIWRISTYLRTFVEPKLDFVKWETRLDIQRRQKADGGKRGGFSTLASANEWTIISSVNTLAALGAILSLQQKVDMAPNVKIGGIAAIVVAHLVIVVWTSLQERKLRRLGDVEQNFLESWRKIRGIETLPVLIGHFLRRELRSLRLELEAYPDEQLIWTLPPGLPNSAGTLALHLAGNLRHYVGAILGGNGYVRNRDEEFAARDVSRAALLEEISEAEAAVASTLPHLSEEQMVLPFPEPIRDRHLQTGELLVQLAVHLSYHLGQISYHRRLVTGDVQGVGALSAAELVAARSVLDPPVA